MKRYRNPAIGEFWETVRAGVPRDACLEWPGYRAPNGYGRYNWALVTRLVWEDVNGAIPPGIWVLHRCDNPPCAWPDHLFLGTPADNSADMVAKGRASAGRVPAHVDEDALCSAYLAGATQEEVARNFHISEKRLRRILLENGHQIRTTAEGRDYRVTFCPRGHEFTVENTYLHARSGWRQCRECRRLRGRKEWAGKGSS